MSKRMSIVFCGMAITLMTAGYATGQTATQDAKDKTQAAGSDLTDAAITAAVKTKFLADTKVSGLNINVDTTNHVVTLTGPVHSAAEKAEALRLARTTKGVNRVVSKLTMEPMKTAAHDMKADAKDKAHDMKSDTKDKAHDMKADTKDKSAAAMDATTDAAITTAVKTKLLADTAVGGLKIDVDTSNHVVTLTGAVHSAAEKAEALRLARTTKGVKSVVSKLTVEPKKN